MSEANKPKQPTFTLEFKQDAARLVIEKGYTHQQAAASLGVSLSALRRWVKAERGDGGQKTALGLADQQELARLRKENERLRMEREILKKAAAFFAKELG
jgi:transposase